MIEELAFSDTFSEWKDKINVLIADHNTLSDIGRDIVGPFTYNRITSTGRVVAIYGGNVRNGSVIETIADKSFTIPANSTRILAIYKPNETPAVLQMFATDALPEKNTIPIAIFTTNATDLTAYTDLRTQFILASSLASAANAVLQFDKIIDQNLTIPSAKNAMSIDPVINDGITVTVSDTSVWVVL